MSELYAIHAPRLTPLSLILPTVFCHVAKSIHNFTLRNLKSNFEIRSIVVNDNFNENKNMAGKGRKAQLQAELNANEELTIFLDQYKDSLIC